MSKHQCSQETNSQLDAQDVDNLGQNQNVLNSNSDAEWIQPHNSAQTERVWTTQTASGSNILHAETLAVVAAIIIKLAKGELPLLTLEQRVSSLAELANPALLLTSSKIGIGQAT